MVASRRLEIIKKNGYIDMLCNWCHKVIPIGEELKEQDVGYSYSSFYEGTGGGESRFIGGGYYHRRCYYDKLDKLLWELKSERGNLWKGRFWIWIPFFPVLIIIVIVKLTRQRD